MTKRELQKQVLKLVEASFKDGKLIEASVTQSIKILKSLPKSQTIGALSEYLKGIRREERKHTLYIETVSPLSPNQLKKIKKIVERKIKITKTLINVNPDILGGFKIRIGDEVWDETLANKIEQLKGAIRS